MSGERITREAIERRLMLPGGVAWVVEVVEALETYGQHKYACATLGTAKSPMNAFEIVNPGPCDCGLEAALARFWAQVER